jgi:uncharacterized protein YjbI with pentapeptide repeats
MSSYAVSTLESASAVDISSEVSPDRSTKANWKPGDPIKVNPDNKDMIKAKERKLSEVIEGTIMRSGVVYPKHKPLPETELDREFLRHGRPASTQREINELIKGLQSGDKDAIANFEKNMAKYLSKANGDRSEKLVDALNDIIDNPNKFKLNKGYAQSLLDKAFDKFITMDYNTKNDLDFSRTNLEGKFIAGLDLRKTKLSGNELGEFTDWANTNVSGLNLKDVNFTSKNTLGTIFKQANLENSTWTGKDMRGNNLSGANLKGANLSNTNLSGNTTARNANFQGANLGGTNASGGVFRSSNLSGANLSNSNFSGSDLRGANLAGANTSGANFSGARQGPDPNCP